MAGWGLRRAECREVRRGRPCRAHSRRAAGSGLTRPEERPGNGALRERLATVRLLVSSLLAAHIPPSAPRLPQRGTLRGLAPKVRPQRRRRVSRGNQRPRPALSSARSGLGCSTEAGGGGLSGPCCSAGPLGCFYVKPAGRERGDFPYNWLLDPGTVGSTERVRERGPQPKQIHRSGECACLFLSASLAFRMPY